MPIQIIDNFDLSSAKAIDNRFVVSPTSFYTNRDDIQWKYVGMRIWDMNEGPNGTPFVWTGTTYSSENLVSIGGSGTVNQLGKFTDTTQIGDSIIYDDGTKIGVLNTSPVYELDVTGTIRATGNLRGNGQFITSLNADEIQSGTLTLNRIQNSPLANYFLSSGSGGIGQSTWVSLSSLTVGSANTLSTSRTLWGQSFNGSSNVTGNITVGGSITNITGSIQFRNSASPIPGVLSISWLGNSNLNKNLYIPSWNGVSRTISLLEQEQTFTAKNTFDSFTNFKDPIQVNGTASFFVTGTIGFSTITTTPLNVSLFGIRVGDTVGGSFITTGGSYTWFDDSDTGMFRGSSPGNTYFKSNNILQMAVGNDVTPVYSSLTEQYTTPGISMMSVLDIWYVDFNLAVTGIPYWLDSANNVTWTSLPTVATNNTSTNYDRMVVINTEGYNTATVYLETAPLSNSFWQVGSIFPDSSYSLIIPAGRRWRVAMIRIGGELVSDSNLDVSPAQVTNDRSTGTYVRFISYKFGMN